MDSFVISSHWKLFFLSQNTIESGYPKCNYIRHKILKNILRYLFIFSTRYSICITGFSSIQHNIIKYTSQDKDHTCTCTFKTLRIYHKIIEYTKQDIEQKEPQILNILCPCTSQDIARTSQDIKYTSQDFRKKLR